MRLDPNTPLIYKTITQSRPDIIIESKKEPTKEVLKEEEKKDIIEVKKRKVKPIKIKEKIIHSILQGNDSLAIMPTGAGKSICYQVPALMLPGITLVISPLISLMQDQVKALNEAGIHAAYINSSLSDVQIARALEAAANGRDRKSVV